MKRISVLAGMCMLALLMTVTSLTLRAQETRKQVLYINSYHRGYKFSDDITRGIESVLKAEGVNVDLRVEYLDTKRVSDAAYLEGVYKLYKQKYANTQIDLVMSSDDAALNFLFKYANDLFPDVPVVFCGANFFDESRLAGYERFTGVSEEIDLRGTLDLALSLHPNTKRVAFVNDTTVTGQKIHDRMLQVVPDYGQIEFIYLEDVTMDEIRQRVSTLPSDSLVLLTLFFSDKAGAFFEYDTFTRAVAESSAVPVYGSWDFSLGFGIVGGKLTSGFTEGERAAQIALRVLSGERPQDIPVVRQVVSSPMFDYEQMTMWGIRPSALPADSVVINQPFSFYETYKPLIWVVGISFVILVIATIGLAFNVLSRRRAQAELSASNRDLQDIRASLEQRVTERTAEVERRAVLLRAASEVSIATATLQDLNQLLARVADLVLERFGLYYVGVFLLDQTGEWAVLHSGTGEFGRQMLAQGHRLERSGASMIGQCISRNEAMVAQDVGETTMRFKNPLLPDTRSEMAVPMRSAGQVIGAITVQSAQEGAFDDVYISVVQTMADQLAVAIENTRLLRTAQEAVQTLETTQRRYFGQAWIEYVERRSLSGLAQTPSGLVPLGEEPLPEVAEAMARQQLLVRESTGAQEATLVAPIVSRGQPVGALGFTREKSAQAWSEDERALAQAISEQFALAADNLRLVEDTQRRAAREQLTRQIVDRVRAAENIEDILRVTSEALSRQLNASEVVVRLGSETELAGDHK